MMHGRTWLVVLLVGVAAIGVGIWRYSSRPKFTSVGQHLDYLVSDTVKSSKQIRNCTLYVAKGDGSFSWSGAAGLASEASEAPMTTDTPIYLASITKLYTATAIMKLYEQGKLSLDDPMAKYLPEDLIHGIDVYQGHDYSDEVTIAQLLAQTSGLADYYTDKPDGGQDLFHIFMADPDRTWTVEELIARARTDLKPHFAPNTNQAYYADTNYALLGKIIESVTGKPLQDVYGEFFFQPLGLTHTWLVGRSKAQIASTTG
ncbi:MAG TPA: serine hydrolase domain-containing protein, partial [Anaerolineales bacterium]|nr:serine hydrolase domain-containing protein [Anaerolineales bacterium]